MFEIKGWFWNSFFALRWGGGGGAISFFWVNSWFFMIFGWGGGGVPLENQNLHDIIYLQSLMKCVWDCEWSHNFSHRDVIFSRWTAPTHEYSRLNQTVDGMHLALTLCHIVTAWTHQVKMKWIKKSPTNFKISECLHHVLRAEDGGALSHSINYLRMFTIWMWSESRGVTPTVKKSRHVEVRISQEK